MTVTDLRAAPMKARQFPHVGVTGTVGSDDHFRRQEMGPVQAHR